jgi:hypothetical protein
MDPVEILNDEYKSIVEFLDNSSQVSLSSDVSKSFAKIIVLSAASYFEHLIQAILIEFISRETGNNTKAINFFKKKAIGMQYHTYFSWGEKDNPDKPGKNANTFFALFGDDFKKSVETEIKSNPILREADTTLGKPKITLEEAVKAFLEVGHLRNILVHSNFAAYNLQNKTPKEVYELYQKGLPFIDYIKSKLEENDKADKLP